MMRLISRMTCLVLFVSLGLALSLQGQSTKKEDNKKPNLLGFLSNGSYQVHYVRLPGQALPTKAFRVFLDHQAWWDDAGVSDPHGAHLRFVMIENQTAQGKHGLTRYRVYAEGASQNKVYSLQTWLVNNATTTNPHDLYVNGQGLVMLRRPRDDEEATLTAGEDELVVESGPAVAEPIRFLLSTLDGQLLIYGTLVAHPLQSRDKGCELEARLAQPNDASYLIVANGFPAKSKITFVYRSGDAVASETVESNSDGHSVGAVSPIVPGMTQGMLKASAEGPNCMPFVVLPWKAATNAAPKTPDQ
jgi:hypothetical protein